MAAAAAAAAEWELFVRLTGGGADGAFAPVGAAPGSGVARLARAVRDAFAPASPLGALRLYLLPYSGRDAPSAAQEAEARELAQPRHTLAEAGVRDGAWLLARLTAHSAEGEPPAELARLAAAVGALSTELRAGIDGVRAGVAGLRADVAVVSADVTGVSADVSAMKQAQDAADAATFVSPTGKQYEELACLRLDGWLRGQCGLLVAEGSRRGIPMADPASCGFQWDARLSVTCDRAQADPTFPASASFLVYGGVAYERPPALPALRNLSPLKPVHAEYYAVVEFTRWGEWTEDWRTEDGKKRRKTLLGRLNTRVTVCLQRAQNAVPTVVAASVLDVVALAGVVGEHDCREAVEHALSREESCAFPALRELFRARRFVFFHFVPVLPVGAPLAVGPPEGGGGGGPSAGVGV